VELTGSLTCDGKEYHGTATELDPIKDKAIINIISRAIVECNVCPARMERGLNMEIFNKHVREVCPIHCKRACGALITIASVNQHECTCPFVEVSCDAKEIGCEVVLQRKYIGEHQTSCIKYQLLHIFRKQQQELIELRNSLRSNTERLTNEQQSQLTELERINQEHQSRLAELDRVNQDQQERLTELDGRLIESTKTMENVVRDMSRTKTYISDWFEVESNTNNTVIHKHNLKTIPISVSIQFTTDVVKLADGKLDTSNVKAVWDVTNNSHYAVGHEGYSGAHHGGSYILTSKEIHISFWAGGYVARQWSIENSWVQHKTGFYRVILQTSPGELKKGSSGCIIA